MCRSALLMTLPKALQLIGLPGQDGCTFPVVGNLLVAEHVLLLLLFIELTGLAQLRAPVFQLASLVFEMADLNFLILHLLFIQLLYIQQVISRNLVVFNLEQGIKSRLTFAGCFEKNRGEGALRNTERVSE